MAEITTQNVDLNANGYLKMLGYEKQIFLDILSTDGLVVCAKGLNCDRVIRNILKVYCDPGNLVLVINAADYEEAFYINSLNLDHVYVAATTSQERERVYLKGGIQFISTRILVVDLLKKRVPVEHVTGIVVLRAHSIVESCQEAFVLRLYRQHNKTGFIRAFSNSAESFTYGYGHVEKVMRSLFVKELQIWPRFHVTVINNLKMYEPTVIELHIPMTDKMISMQTCILDLMNFICKDLKRINRYLDLQEITVENCVTKKFHKILQSQLDCIWHQLSSNTKQLISDLKVLRSLMICMIYNDAVSMYAMMRQYRTTEYAMKTGGWILLDSAEQLFKLTKERVFTSEEFDPEPCPKWKCLTEILKVEIPMDIKENSKKAKGPVKVLILCQDSKTCYQLNQYLTMGPERYLFYTALKNEIPIPKISKNYSSFDLKSVTSEILANKNERKEKAKTTVESKSVAPEGSCITSKYTLGKRFLRDRVAGKILEGKEAEENSNAPDALGAILENDDIVEDFNKTSYVLTMSQKGTTAYSSDSKEQFDFTQMENTDFETFPEMENLDITALTCDKPVVCIQTFKNEQGVFFLQKTLEDLNPAYVIMFHANVTAIRQIEVYEARLQRNPEDRLKVFFLIHAATVEEQSYLTNLRREKQAFELLIETKSTMVVPEYQDGKSDGHLSLQRELKKTQEKNTRQAGGQEAAVNVALPRIIVDMREFRSDLPSLIHKRGIEVDPVTITIGDYILTPDICIERKSISDLIGSLNSGRLYNQCIQMSRFYSKPMLLIEFDQNRPFHLQGHYIVSNDISNADVQQKLQLLTLHFPKLRIIWSPSPYATAQLFEELKQGKEQPCPIQAAALGSDATTPDMDFVTDRYNTAIHDFLMKLPGITSKNIASVMSKGKSLDNILKMNKVELGEIVGNSNDAKMLWDIFHLVHKAVPENDNKSFGKSKFSKPFRGRKK